MNRRGFIKFLVSLPVAAVAATVLPKVAGGSALPPAASTSWGQGHLPSAGGVSATRPATFIWVVPYSTTQTWGAPTTYTVASNATGTAYLRAFTDTSNVIYKPLMYDYYMTHRLTYTR